MVTSVLTLGLAPWLVGLATVGFLLICLLLVLIVLIQRPQGGGLSGAFGAGGGGSGQTAFGAKTGDALTIATVSVFVLFLVGAVLLNFAIRPPEEGEPAQQTAAEQTPADAGEAATESGEGDETATDESGESAEPPANDAGDDASAEETTPPSETETPADDEPAEGEGR
jgi:preprotein translocase subunit SecG